MLKSYKDTKFKTTFLLESFYDYFEVLKEISNVEKDEILWYRGQFRENWNILPNLFRYSKEVADYWGRPVDPLKQEFHLSGGYQVTFPDFVKELGSFKERVTNSCANLQLLPKNDFEWLFLGQHYGLLTPLVDFTTDPLIALFFSIEGEFRKKEYIQTLDTCKDSFYDEGCCESAASVFVMLPKEVNKLSFYKENGNDIKKPIFIDNYYAEVLKAYTTWENVCFTPLCIVAPKTDYRIIRQSGNFLIYGGNTQAIDFSDCYKNALYKIYIPYSILNEIKQMLFVMNLTKSSVYGLETYGSMAKNSKSEAIELFDEKLKEISKQINKGN